jgi:ABC-type transport system involved in multi-copper enzyme maturation permease subunit
VRLSLYSDVANTIQRSMTSRIATIARYTVLEAVRTRLPLVTLVCIVALLGASFFVREIAIAESTRFQTAFYAAAVRFAVVFIAALHVVASISREFQDKNLDVTLALDLPRSHYIVGKLAGFIVIAAALALAAALPLVPLAGLDAAGAWSASLALELALVVGFSLFCAVTFSQLMPAVSVVMAFYVFARALTAMRLIGENPIAGAHTLSHQVMTWLIEALALIVPALDVWTRTAWLVDGVWPWTALPQIAAHAVLFIVVVAAAAVFDMHRKNF